MRPRRLTFFLPLFALLLLSGPVGCKEFEQLFLAKDEPVQPCDPTYSTYHGYVHFIERDFLTRDGTLDYRKWFDANRVDASQCDPLRVNELKESNKNAELEQVPLQPWPDSD